MSSNREKKVTETTKTVPNQQLIDLGTPTIMLAGQAWPIPLLSPKQLRVVLPPLLSIIPRIAASYSVIQVTNPETGQQEPKSVADMVKLSELLDNGGIDSIYTIIFNSLLKGHPKLTKEEFEDMPIGTFEMIDSLMVIGRQTGVMRSASKEETAKVGEAAAASQ
jgi:hypothetical protein